MCPTHFELHGAKWNSLQIATHTFQKRVRLQTKVSWLAQTCACCAPCPWANVWQWCPSFPIPVVEDSLQQGMLHGKYLEGAESIANVSISRLWILTRPGHKYPRLQDLAWNAKLMWLQFMTVAHMCVGVWCNLPWTNATNCLPMRRSCSGYSPSKPASPDTLPLNLTKLKLWKVCLLCSLPMSKGLVMVSAWAEFSWFFLFWVNLVAPQ